jgi:uncharacterized repeat protein (TIGR01451 family)
MFSPSSRQGLYRTLQAFWGGTGRKRKCRSQGFRPWVEGLEHRTTPTTINLTPVADNTLYQVATADPSQQLSNGAGQHFYVGDTNQGSNDIRRGAIKFDLSTIPTGSTILSATLTLNLSKTRNAAETIALHRALTNWGEGTSNAGAGGVGAGEGDGVQATTGSVTWFFASFPSQRWTTLGGDFAAAASASTSVGSVGRYQWTGAGMTADVQQWVNNAATSFGWIFTGNESGGGTSKQFDTKENTTAANRPVLTVDFTPPTPLNLAISMSHTGNFRQGDAADTYTVTVSNNGSGPTTGSVTVTDRLPAGLAPTAADNGNMNGWTVTTSGQTVTATRSDVLAPGSSYPALTLTVSVASDAPASVTNTATVTAGGQVNTATDPTTITQTTNGGPPVTQVTDLTIAMSHTGNFTLGGTGVYTITVSNTGGSAVNTPVTVTDVLPTGLTYAGLDTVNGWTISVDGQTITATRTDDLLVGASFPALTLTVSVASNAPTSFFNTATLSSGGDFKAVNDEASDIALGQSQRRRGDVSSPSAAPMATVLNGVSGGLLRSDEYLTNLVAQYYTQLLHRTPSAAEVNYWTSLLRSGLSDEQVLAGFASSAEYFARVGGTDQAWMEALYQDLLGRGSDAGGKSWWLSRLASGTNRFSIAGEFLASVEYETKLVAADYQRYLGRTANAAELAGWVNNLQRGMSDEQMIAAFVTSDEFFFRQGSSIQGWLDGAYQTVLKRDPDPNGFRYWEGSMLRQMAGIS